MKLSNPIGSVLALAVLCATATVAQAAPPSADLRSLQGERSAADILGARVRSADGEDVGEIQDLVVAADAKVVTAVVSVGGILDVADKLVAVPYADLRLAADGETLVIPLTQAETKAAQAYEKRSATTGGAGPIADPELVAPPDATDRREAEAEASRSFAGDDPRVADGIAENKKAYKDEAAAAKQDADR